MASSSNEPAGPQAGQPARRSRRASSGGRATGAARRLNRLAGGAAGRLGKATGGAATWLRERAGRARGVATSAPVRRLLPAAGAASALGAVASLAGRSRRRRGRGLAGMLDRLLAGPAAAYRRQRRRRRVRAAGRLLGGVAAAPLHAAGGLGAGRRRQAPAPPRPIARRRRSKKMAGNFKLAVGLAAGYVLGTRAGRERYERLVETARNVADRPEVRELTGRLRDRLGTVLGNAAGGAGEGGDSGSEEEPARSADDSTPTADRSRPSDQAPPDTGDEAGERRRERGRAARAARR
jgi:hypothetical protein